MAGFGVVPVLAGDSGDNSTNVEITNTEETNIEETNIEETNTDITVDDADKTNTNITVDDADNVIFSGGPVTYEENTTEITDIDTNITDIDTDITTLENSTQVTDNSYNYSDNSRTIIQNVETTNVNVDNSQSTTVAFTESTVVNNINFVSKDSGETKVIVQDIKDEECLETLPAGNVYTSFNIFIDNAEMKSNIEDAAVDFKVEKTWLIENNLDSSVIILNMYENGEWVEVPVTITGEDSKFVYFTAEVSEYSTFAITSKTVTIDKVLKQTDAKISDSEEIAEPTKNVIIKMLEFIIELLKGE